MVKIVNGHVVTVPDDERITPQMKLARSSINDMLQWMSSDSPKVRQINEQYRQGMLSRDDCFDWYGPSASSGSD